MKLDHPVSEIMTKDLITVSETTPLHKMKDLIKRRSIHHIPVENEQGKLLGIISTEDFARAAHFPVPDDKLLARHIMTATVLTISENTPVKEVVRHFLENKFRAIPVVNKREVLCGIVTPFDVMALLMSKHEAPSG